MHLQYYFLSGRKSNAKDFLCITTVLTGCCTSHVTHDTCFFLICSFLRVKYQNESMRWLSVTVTLSLPNLRSCTWDLSCVRSGQNVSLQLFLRFCYSASFDGCCLLPPPTVPQPQPESRPEEHYLEQQARLHHSNSHLLLHWPLLLPDSHWWRHTQVTQILCTQTRSAGLKFLLDTTQITHRRVCVSQWFLCKTPRPLWFLYKIFFLVTVTKIKEVYLNSSGPVQALKGEKLVLNCTAIGELNSRVNITWDYPRKVRPTLKSVETLYEAEKQRFRWQRTFDRDWAGVCNSVNLQFLLKYTDKLFYWYLKEDLKVLLYMVIWAKVKGH